MEALIADVAVESEAHLSLAMRAAQAVDLSETNRTERLLSRFLVPLAKFWICKRAPVAIVELLECMGGNGYVEEGVLARLYREAPLNGIWEGSGNVICLDLLRVLRREPEIREALRGEIRVEGSAVLDRLWAEIDDLIDEAASHERAARRLAEQIAIAVQYSLLLRHAPEIVSDTFRVSRIEAPHLTFGAFKSASSLRAIIERATVT